MLTIIVRFPESYGVTTSALRRKSLWCFSAVPRSHCSEVRICRTGAELYLAAERCSMKQPLPNQLIARISCRLRRGALFTHGGHSLVCVY